MTQRKDLGRTAYLCIICRERYVFERKICDRCREQARLRAREEERA